MLNIELMKLKETREGIGIPVLGIGTLGIKAGNEGVRSALEKRKLLIKIILIFDACNRGYMPSNEFSDNEKRIRLEITLSSEAYGLIKAESESQNQPIDRILDRLILEGCQIAEGLPPESHTKELKGARDRLGDQFNRFDIA
jgi:hypothetical protein